MRTTVARQDLSEEQVNFKKRIVAVEAESKQDDATAIYNVIVAKDINFLLQLAMRDEHVNNICNQSQFDSHWQNAWRQLGLNPLELSASNADPFHENMPMITVSCLDLLKGDYIYQQYRSLIKKQFETTEIFHYSMTAEIYEKAKACLEESAGYGCFFALNALCKNGLIQLHSLSTSVERRDTAEKIITYAKKAADLYFTPGYLLLSNVWQELFLFSKDIYPNSLDENMSKKSFYTKAAIALHASQKLEKVSLAMINNAYQGKTIWQACNGVISSWLHAKVRLQRMAGSLLTLNDINEAALIAVIEVNNLNKVHNLVVSESQQVSENPVSSKASESKLSI